MAYGYDTYGSGSSSSTSSAAKTDDTGFDWGKLDFGALSKDIGDILTGINKSASTIESAKLTQEQAQANISTYEQYLRDFPQYESYKETVYKTQESQTLADRLANMGMRGITTGGSGTPTSAATVYTGEQSLYEQGYAQLVNSLELEKTSAQGKLKVAQATLETAKQTENSGWGSIFGGLLGGVTGFIIGGPAGAAAGYSLGSGAGGIIGGMV